MAGGAMPADVHRSPAGPAVVVLVHGAVERGEGFADVKAHLPGCNVVTYDRQGHGGRWEEGPGTLAGDTEELLDLVGERPAVVVGHSLGGLVVLGAALRRPALFISIGLYETAIPWADWWTEGERVAMLEEIERNSAAVREGASPDRGRLEVAWESCRQEVVDAFGAPYRWQDLSVRLTTGRGALSEGYSARDAGIVADYFGAERVSVPDAGHRAHRTHPAAFAEFVRSCIG
jgi:pimeloyl-ACP methyl ester carboxylesterase